VQGAFGLPGGYVSAPVRVGARGAEEPLELRLSLEERAALQRCSRPA
jgi:malate/lactate dehydrogenase